MKKPLMTLAVALLLGFTQNSFAQHDHDHASHSTTTATKVTATKVTATKVTATKVVSLGKVDNSVKKQIDAVLVAYYGVKDALVATDSKAAKAKAIEFLAVLAKVSNAKMTDDQKKFWATISEKIKADAKHISEDADTAHQRQDFETLSNDMYAVIKSFGANSGTAYRQYCPMAFNDKGAFWLSDKKEIRNPYFGNQMLKCGSVKEEL